MEFRESFGGFDTQAMQIEVFGVLSALEQALGFNAGFRSDRYEGEPDDIEFARCFRRKEIRNCKATSLFLAREREA